MYFKLSLFVLCIACSPKVPPPQTVDQVSNQKELSPTEISKKVRRNTYVDQLTQNQQVVSKVSEKVADKDHQQRCVKDCQQRRQAEAISAQMIENECKQSCASDASPSLD